MPRSILLPLTVLLLAGCTSGSIAPGRLPEGATSGVYTVAEPQALAACIATALGSPAQPVGDRLEIASLRQPGVRYSVGSNRDGIIYPTQVAVTGTESDPQEVERVNMCINAAVTG